MRRPTILIVLALVSLAAAAFAALRRPVQPVGVAVISPVPAPIAVASPAASGPLTVTAQLERKWLSQSGSAPYLQLDIVAAGTSTQQPKAPVNAVLVIDRSGSMAGEKIARARDAARELIAALDGEDRLAIVDFASDARVLVPSTAMTPGAKERALAFVHQLVPTSGTNFSGAFRLAAPQLVAGRAQGRVDKVFLASDGMVNEGVVERTALLRLAREAFEGATLSTFGVGVDYDEELMEALASQAGGRSRFVERADTLAPAFKTELARAAGLVAKEVKLAVAGLSGASVEQVFGYELENGIVRLPDFAAGETRRVLVRLHIPGGKGEAQLAEVSVNCLDASGRGFLAKTSAGGTFTADAERLREAPSKAAAQGARAEMAQIARQAMSAFESGDVAGAQKMEAQIDALSSRVAKDLPAAAPKMEAEAREWRAALGKGAAGGSAEKKKMKQQSNDTLRDLTVEY